MDTNRNVKLTLTLFGFLNEKIGPIEATQTTDALNNWLRFGEGGNRTIPPPPSESEDAVVRSALEKGLGIPVDEIIRYSLSTPFTDLRGQFRAFLTARVPSRRVFECITARFDAVLANSSTKKRKMSALNELYAFVEKGDVLRCPAAAYLSVAKRQFDDALVRFDREHYLSRLSLWLTVHAVPLHYLALRYMGEHRAAEAFEPLLQMMPAVVPVCASSEDDPGTWIVLTA
ncbi:MAG TPA: hypothetical protein VMT81_03400 [Candidatus Paceibacterota bacterium]|nr:hypothetical protein [Candidatus Paceibacterota bacterium]